MEFWQSFDNPYLSVSYLGLIEPLPENKFASEEKRSEEQFLQMVQQEILPATRSVEALQYWAYHIARLTFFLTQGTVGLLAVDAAMLRSRGPSSSEAPTSLFLRMTQEASFHAGGRVREAVATFQWDLKNIQAGAYKMPWDMVSLNHRQYSLGFNISRSLANMVEMSAIMQKRQTRNGQPSGVWFQSPLYPQYYINDFHYQTDGWFSEGSARRYDFSTEALFVGRQDAMQRSALVPLAQFMDAKNPQGMKLLEVACGTGRFHTFIKDNYPEMSTIASDLSPFYLEAARGNIQYWQRLRARGKDLGGWKGTGTEFLQAPMEKLGLEDRSVDVVICVHTFHEMPFAARQEAVKEFARVLKPGGMLVLTDSFQKGDRPHWDDFMGRFGNLNEPHYQDYVQCDLGEMCERVGLLPDMKVLSSVTKTLSFKRPE